VSAREVTHNRAAHVLGPWQPQILSRKFFRMRNVKGRRKRRLFPDLIGTEQLCYLHDRAAAVVEILESNRAVAGAQIDPKAESCAH
jgi:hypothetical protein